MQPLGLILLQLAGTVFPLFCVFASGCVSVATAGRLNAVAPAVAGRLNATAPTSSVAFSFLFLLLCQQLAAADLLLLLRALWLRLRALPRRLDLLMNYIFCYGFILLII